MNNERRKQIEAAIQKMEEAKAELEKASSDEQDYFDNMPESIQSGDRGTRAEEAIQSLDDAVSSIDDAVSSAQAAIE